MENKIKCCICGNTIEENSYNPEPVNHGRCCDKCNVEVVIPRREEFKELIRNRISVKLENWTIEELTGYKVLTTFYTDFSIGEMFGLDSIKSTYDTCFNESKDNYQYVTELCMVLNWKMFRWFKDRYEFYQLYKILYTELDRWCIDNLKGDELEYYYQNTD